jgi:ATP-binding cassette subfamily B protein RaxB
MSLPFLRFSSRRRLPLIRQAEAAECGLASLAMVAGFHGYETDLATLRRQFAISLKGATLKSLIDIAARMGLGTRALRCELEEMKELRTPAILHWGMGHFVVLKRIVRGGIEIHDPAIGARIVKTPEVSRHFTGVALELTPTDGFEKKNEKNLLKLSTLAKFAPETVRGLIQAIVLSLIIELCVLAAPFYMQFVIDEAILKGDGGFLTAIAVGFAMVTLFSVVATALRGLTLQFVSSALSFDMEAKVFHHLLRLPLDWFHKRQVGDVQSRFHSIASIQQFITNGAVSVFMDGVLSIFIVALMFYYSTTLGAVAVVAVALYAGLRIAMIGLARRVSADYIVNEAKEASRFLESLRAIQTLKASGAEAAREGLQRNAVATTLNSAIRMGNVNIGFNAVNQAVSGLTDILIVFLGAKAVMSADLTVGMLTAFMAYQRQFTSRFANLVENFIAWRLLDVHLERLADIALAPKDEVALVGGHEAQVQGEIVLQDLAYRYAPSEPEVLRGVDLTIRPGEFVAIAGASGCGKSTLIKIVAGLYKPSRGSVLIDGQPLDRWNAQTLRSQIALVAQDDSLLQGTLAENISGFDDKVDMQLVRVCAELAQIRTDIERMPMGYESLVGDMGSTLSGGQKQRVLLARALYRRPRILILDEGTSHLDVESEKAVNAALSELAITRLVVAHRPETLRAAGRVVSLEGGVAREASAVLNHQQERSHENVDCK